MSRHPKSSNGKGTVMNRIPDDVWIGVIRYIPDVVLKQLLGVNSVFFHKGMQLRYESIKMSTRNPKRIAMYHARLSSPIAASCVRALDLEVTHTRVDQQASESSHSLPALKKTTVMQRVEEAFRHKLRLGNSSSNKSGPSEEKPKTPASFTQMIDQLIAILPGLSKLNYFRLDIWDVPPTYDFKTFFPVAWASFGRNLNKLSIGATVDGYRAFVASNPPLTSLKVFHLEFTSNLYRSLDNAADQRTLVTVVAPFVNSLAPQIHKFSIWCWVALDLSEFFKHLGAFPELEDLTLRVPFNKAFKSDPSGLRHLLHAVTPTLTALNLRLNPQGSGPDPVPERVLGKWLLDCIVQECLFTKVRKLDLYPSTSPSGVNVIINAIHNASAHLREVTVRDRCLQEDEIPPIIDALAACDELISLRLNIFKINVALFDILSHKLPRLKRLRLLLADNAAAEGAGSFNTFTEEIQTRVYNWDLKDLSISQSGAEWDESMYQLMWRSIPSVERWGVPRNQIY